MKRNWSDIHPKLIATAIGGALLVGLQATVQALQGQDIAGPTGTVVALLGALAAGYFKTGD